MQKPKKRSALRARLGMFYYSTRRKLKWIGMRHHFATSRMSERLPFLQFSHRTILLRKLKDVDMILQHNKITNLKLAAEKIDGVVLYPGQIFSFWYLVGKTSAKKGYKEGMVLKSGKVDKGIGGGLCQMTNLIYWMTLHTPLTVIERHRHGYDVFPDSGRTQPFASGATCYYPHLDLMIRNDTDRPFQLCLFVDEEHLNGMWLSDAEPLHRYEIHERNHEMRNEFWGGYSRHNELYRQVFDMDGRFLKEEFVTANSAIMMYAPFLAAAESDHSGYDK